MSRSSLFILIGVVVLLSPFLGLPGSFLAFIDALSGLVLVGLGVSMRSREAAKAAASTPAEPEQPAPSAIA